MIAGPGVGTHISSVGIDISGEGMTNRTFRIGGSTFVWTGLVPFKNAHDEFVANVASIEDAIEAGDQPERCRSRQTIQEGEDGEEDIGYCAGCVCVCR